MHELLLLTDKHHAEIPSTSLDLKHRIHISIFIISIRVLIILEFVKKCVSVCVCVCQ